MQNNLAISVINDVHSHCKVHLELKRWNKLIDSVP